QVNQNWTGLATDGWSLSGSVYTKTHTFPNGDSYTATITPNPGNVYNPYDVTSVATVNPAGGGLLAAIGLGGATTPPVARAVLAHPTRVNLLIKGMVARHAINLNGNGIMTDSFDSSAPAYSTLGRYPMNDLTKTRANGDIAVNDSVTNAVSGG